jgi:hypothetical protein
MNQIKFNKMSFARPKGNPQALKKFSSPAKPITKHSPKPQIQQQPERCINFPNSSYQGLSGLYRFKEQVDLCYAKINPDDFTVWIDGHRVRNCTPTWTRRNALNRH